MEILSKSGIFDKDFVKRIRVATCQSCALCRNIRAVFFSKSYRTRHRMQITCRLLMF